MLVAQTCGRSSISASVCYPYVMCFNDRFRLILSLFFICRYGFGREGKPELQIGPNKTLLYEVTLRDFKKVNLVWTKKEDSRLPLSVSIYINLDIYLDDDIVM